MPAPPHCCRWKASARIIAVSTWLSVGLAAQKPVNCNAPTLEPSVHLRLPAGPFTPVATPDGCWVFVPMSDGASGINQGVAVVRRSSGTLRLDRVVPLTSGGRGATLTHDGKLLIVATGSSVAFLDVGRLTTGAEPAVLGHLAVGADKGAVYVGVTRNDDLLFVSLEDAAAILVVDLTRIRNSVFDSTSVLGTIPVGHGPIALTFANDDRYLYTTSQVAWANWAWPVECRPEGADQAAANPLYSQGAVVVIDVARARTDAAHAVLARAPAGCNPVRLALSPDGNTAWVAARGSHAVVALDTRKFLTDPMHATVARLPVGKAPVGVAVVDEGRRVIATNSDRFAGDSAGRQSLSVIDVSNGATNAAVAGFIPAGAFPRELRVTADGRTLLVGNFASKTLQVVDLRRLAPQKAAP